VLDLLRHAGIRSGLLVDLGCGSGIMAAEVCAAGYDVLGIDISAAMIALARSRAPRARFRVESLLTAELPPCIAVTAIGECLGYLFDEVDPKEALHALVRRIFEAPGARRVAGLRRGKAPGVCQAAGPR